MVKLFISDVDGVLTDGSMYYSNDGNEFKRFSTYDGMGFQLLRERGVKTCLITSEKTRIVELRAAKMKIDFLFQGEGYFGKLKVAQKLCDELSIDFSEVSYIGDDLNCKELLEAVSYKACPSNARSQIKNIENIFVLNTQGGDGAVREWAEMILAMKFS